MSRSLEAIEKVAPSMNMQRMEKSHHLQLLNSMMRLTLLLTCVASAQSWHIYYKNNCEDNVSVSNFFYLVPFPFPLRSKQLLLAIIKYTFKGFLQAIQFAFSDPVRVISLHLEPNDNMESQSFDNETVTVMCDDAGLTAHFRRERTIATRYHLDNRNAYSASEMSLEIRPRG